MRYLMIDRIERLDPGRSAAGWKNVALSEDYLEWHFPERPILPGTLALEAAVQLGGWLEFASSGSARWFLLDRVVSARFPGFSLPGDRLDLRLECAAAAESDRRAYRGEARVQGQVRATFEFEGVAVDASTLDDPARLARLYRVLRGEPPAGRAASSGS